MRAFYRCQFAFLLRSKELLVSLGVCFLFCWAGYLMGIVPSIGSYRSFIAAANQQFLLFSDANALLSNIYLFLLLPILSSASVMGLVLTEKKAQMKLFLLIRGSRSAYYSSGLAVTFTVGFFLHFIPLCLNQALCLSAFPLESMAVTGGLDTLRSFLFAEDLLYKNLFLNAPYLYNFVNILQVSLVGGLCAALTYVVSLHVPRKPFVSFFAPFLLYAFNTLIAQILGKFNRSFAYYLYGNPGISGLSVRYFFVCIAVLCLICGLLLSFRIRRTDELLT